MRLWTCFVCASGGICSHREPELVAWALRIKNAPELVAAAREAAAMELLDRVLGNAAA